MIFDLFLDAKIPECYTEVTFLTGHDIMGSQCTSFGRHFLEPILLKKKSINLPVAVHIFQAFTSQGDQVFSYPTFRYYSSNQDKAKFLTANVEEDIAALTSQLDILQQTLGQIRQQKVQLDSDIQMNTQEERKSETQLMKIREAKRKISLVS